MNKKVALCAFCAICIAGRASAVMSASAFITFTPSGSNWDYDIHLTNTGTTNIGTLWYAWVPGKGFLPSVASNPTSPVGWNPPALTDAGKAILWQASTPLAPGGTLSGFKFRCASSPAALAGMSWDGTNLVGTSFVYSGGPFSDNGFVFVASPVPEPATISAFAVCALLLIRRRR